MQSFPTPSHLLQHHAVKPKVIVSDFDGTFVGSNLTISKSTIRAYLRAQSKGIHIILATGRTLSGCNDILKLNHLENVVSLTPGVYSNGSIVYGIDKNVLVEHVLNKSVASDVINFVINLNAQITETNKAWKEDPAIKQAPEEHGFYPVRNFSLPPQYIDVAIYSRDLVFFQNKPNQLSDGFLQFGDGKPVFVPSLVEIVQTEPANKIIIFTHSETILNLWKPEIANILKEQGSLSGAIKRMLEISPKNVNKAAGIKLLLEKLNLAESEAVALGDGENDVEMLKLIPLSFCMTSSTTKECVQKAAKYSTKSADHDGWSQTIELVCNTYTYCNELDEEGSDNSEKTSTS